MRRMLATVCVAIRRALRLPTKWLASWLVPVDKKNEKSSCARFRLLHLLDPMSKAWAMARWLQVPV
eukprot:8898048-Lingulodinium_polyedra.AAC.1